MVLLNWLSSWKSYHSCNRISRRTRRRSLGQPQPLEIRTLLSAISFTEQTEAANPLNAFDVGAYSTPTLGDLDGDGDLDLIAGLNDGTFKYFRNTGTALVPVFTEQTGTDNPLNGIDVGSFSTPTLGDLDGDGDLDLIAGESAGTFKYFMNTGTALAPVFTEQTGTANPFNGFDVGGYSTPTLGDLDGDGDLDLIAGLTYGTLKYYRNTGSATGPVFTEQTGTDNPLNGFDVNGASSSGFSAPTLGDLDGDGDLDLIAGLTDGTLKYYRNTGTALAPLFTELSGTDNPLNGFDTGTDSAPTLGDLDGDGELDLIAGEDDGAFKYYRNTTVPVDDLGFIEQTGSGNPLDGVDAGSWSSLTLGDLDGD
ncbi:MAG: VCBS repeat-containing protein, partial [Planctomycetaceae bacterium]|nr:VCBS repeat-containing protein [Planctomycetaceae bacterium]